MYTLHVFQISAAANGYSQDSTTKLAFDHVGFPAGRAELLAAGWHTHYWEPLRKYLE